MAPDPSRGKQSRLGKGLSALIGEVEGVGLAPAPVEAKSAEAASGAVSGFAISDIRPNPAQPRRSFSEAELEELAASIKQLKPGVKIATEQSSQGSSLAASLLILLSTPLSGR